MRQVPGTLQDGGAPFQQTQWSVVHQAAQAESPEAAERALTSFCQAYWPPLYAFLRRRGHRPADAQDLTQAFFVRLLEQNTLSRAWERLQESFAGEGKAEWLTALKPFIVGGTPDPPSHDQVAERLNASSRFVRLIARSRLRPSALAPRSDPSSRRAGQLVRRASDGSRENAAR